MLKIDGVEVTGCKRFDKYWTRKCDGKYNCESSPNCEYKKKMRKKEKEQNEKK